MMLQVGGFFIIGDIIIGDLQWNLLKGAELIAQFLEAGFFAQAGKQFLPNRANELSAPILDEFP